MDNRDAAIQGTASLIGTGTCLVIAIELYADLMWGTSHFPSLPRWVKFIAMCEFTFWAYLEALKVRRQGQRLLKGG